GQKYYFIPYKMGRILVHTAIYVGAYFITAEMGRSEIFSALFFNKLLVCLLALGMSYALERFLPVVWKEVEEVKPGEGKAGS
ncbi:MAG TPA: hypothetical protein VHS96_10475, partial [Bacteroidia bacterium]|nr:hypothetical protein [Bacteroidia bacterium]